MTTPGPGNALFTYDGECYLPTDRSRGPWSPDALHGGPVGALIAHCVERRLHDIQEPLTNETAKSDNPADDGRLRIARQTVDLFRPVPFARLDVEVEAIRTGRRVAVFRTLVRSEGKLLTQATTLCLRAAAAYGSVGADHGHHPPPAPEEAAPITVEREGNRWTSYPGTLEMRHVNPPGGSEPPVTWIRPDAPVLDGAPFTPAVRAASIADFVSPFANMQPGRSGYVNADITMYLNRIPEGGWHYLRIVSRGANDGVAAAQAVLGDRRGAYGACSAASLINL